VWGRPNFQNCGTGTECCSSIIHMELLRPSQKLSSDLRTQIFLDFRPVISFNFKMKFQSTFSLASFTAIANAHTIFTQLQSGGTTYRMLLLGYSQLCGYLTST
jgi:hypothetical protein